MTCEVTDGFPAAAWRARHLFAVVPLCGLGTGALYPIVALELDALGQGTAMIATITSIYYLGSFLGSVVCGPLVERWSHRGAFALAAGLAASSTWGLSLIEPSAAWLGLRFLNGFALGAYYLVNGQLAGRTGGGAYARTYARELRSAANGRGRVIPRVMAIHPFHGAERPAG